jgi:hypothetical protein
LRDDFHDRGGRVRIGLDIDVRKRVPADPDQSRGEKQYDDGAVESPLDEFRDHE